MGRFGNLFHSWPQPISERLSLNNLKQYILLVGNLS